MRIQVGDLAERQLAGVLICKTKLPQIVCRQIHHRTATESQEGKRKKKDEIVQQALGKRIRQLREKKGWSQEDFAARSGLHRTFVGNIERGLKNTTILTLMMISRALGITVAELLRGLERRVEELRKRTAKPIR